MPLPWTRDTSRVHAAESMEEADALAILARQITALSVYQEVSATMLSSDVLSFQLCFAGLTFANRNQQRHVTT